MKQKMLVTGEFYHICTKSIAGYKIFNEEAEFFRITKILLLSRSTRADVPLSQLLKAGVEKLQTVEETVCNGDRQVRILAYCIMPTHLHLLLQQKREHGISKFMNRVLNSYTRFFNLRHARKGPLWEKRFERVWIENDAHLLHETRYIHLNPVTAYLAEDPASWKYSSYAEYLSEENKMDRLCEFRDLIDMKTQQYRQFVLADKENQRLLAKARKTRRETQFSTA